MKSASGLAAFLLWLAMCPLLTAATTTGQTGEISGTVVDENGQPLSQAKVNADPLDSRPRSSAVRYVETSDDGHFVLGRLAWGTYRVFAKKEEAGYPDMQWSFYSNDLVTTAVLTAAQPRAVLQIRLGPRCAVLKGSVTNALSGAPLSSGLKLSRAENPQEWISTSLPPEYRVLLPPSTNVLLQVSAAGFKTWVDPAPLRLQPGAEFRLDISLEPTQDPSLHPSEFMIPDGYVGWVLLHFNAKDAPLSRTEAGLQVFKFPPNGILTTSSCGPTDGAENEFFYYSDDGSVRSIPTDYRNGKGMIWGQYQGATNGLISQFGFFIGSEEQYKKFQTRMTHPGPVSAQEH